MSKKKSVLADVPLFHIRSSELDFFTFIEHDYPPPIAFENREALQRWANAGRLQIDNIGRRDGQKNVILVHGRFVPYFGGDGLWYSQVWASVNYKKYRNAIKFHIRTTEGNEKPIGIYDGDHAVGQTRLKKVWPDAWVNMILVERRVNRAIGSMLEKEPLVPDPLSDGITINPECILKTFLTREGALERSQMRAYLKEARQRFASIPNRPSSFERLVMGLSASGFFSDLEHDLEDNGFFSA
jgi:hypothetical protein